MKNYIRLAAIFIFVGIFIAHLYPQDISTGIRMIKNERYEEAKILLSSLKNDRQSTESFFYLGQIYFVQNNIDSALICFNKGVEANKDFPLNYAGRYKVNVVKNNLSETVSDFEKAIDSEGKLKSTVFVTLAEAYSGKSNSYNFEKAKEYLDQAIKADVKNIDALIALGKLYFAANNGTEAIKKYENALDVDRNNSEVLTLKAQVYILIKNFEEAILLLNQAIQNDSTYAVEYRVLAELYAELKFYSKAAEYYLKYLEVSTWTPEKIKRYAALLYLNKDYTRTVELLKPLEFEGSELTSTTRILAYSYFKMDDLQSSKIYFEKLFDADSVEYLTSDYENYSELLSKAGNDSLAIEYLYKIIKTDSSRNDVYGKISVLQFKNKNWEGVTLALKNKKNLTAQEYFDLGKAYYFVSENLLAGLVQKISERIPLTPELKASLRSSIIKYQQSPGDDASTNEFIKSIQGSFSQQQKNNFNSIKDEWLQEAKSAPVYSNYISSENALSNLNEKAPELAIGFFWKARVKTNLDPETTNGLAKPDYEKFISMAEPDSIKFKKELSEAYSYMGYFYYLQNDNGLSKQYWEKVLSVEPENKQAADVLKHLK
ncbi:MAG: tetratricopeptide repeat protein [Ignavibacteriales bacterium]|nr:MAG: tetratricopeptide repeat protein [Ignavibacteriales bacterium]